MAIIEIERLREMVQQAAGKAQRSDVFMLPMHPAAYAELVRSVTPRLYALHSAGWRSGFTVNGIPASILAARTGR